MDVFSLPHVALQHQILSNRRTTSNHGFSARTLRRDLAFLLCMNLEYVERNGGNDLGMPC